MDASPPSAPEPERPAASEEPRTPPREDSLLDHLRASLIVAGASLVLAAFAFGIYRLYKLLFPS